MKIKRHMGFYFLAIFLCSLPCGVAESPLSLPDSRKTPAPAQTSPSKENGAQLDDEVRQLVLASPSQAQLPDDAVVFLLIEEKDRVNEDGTAEMQVHKLVKILNEAGKDMSRIEIPYNRAREDIRIDVARTIKPDARIVNIDTGLIQDVAPLSQLIIFDDIRVRQMVLPDVSVGDCLELKYTIHIKKPVVKGSWSTYFAHPFFMTLKCRLSIDLPESMKGQYVSRIQEPSKPAINRKEGRVIYAWEIKPLSIGGQHEPAIPPSSEVDSFVFFSTMGSWNDLTAWYVPLFEANLKSIDPEIRKKAAFLTRSSGGDRIRMIKDLFRFVSQEVQYVQVGLGDSGWVPYPPEYVLANRYGDCKGKASLFIAMLRSVGIDAYGVLIRPLQYGRLFRDIPSEGNFVHIIVAVPMPDGKYLFMDPTIPMAPYDFLDPFEEDRDVVILDRAEAHFEKTPVLPLEKSNSSHGAEKAVIEAGGTAEVDGSDSATGLSAINARMMIKNTNPSILKDLLVAPLRKKYPRSTLESYQYDNLEDVDQPFIMRSKFKISGAVQFAGDMMLVEPGSNVVHGLLPLVTFDQRTYPLFLVKKELRVSEGILVPPEGYSPKTVPPAISISNPFGSYERHTELKGDQLVTNTRFTIDELMVSREEYPRFKKFIEQVFAAENEKFVFEKKKAPEVSRPGSTA